VGDLNNDGKLDLAIGTVLAADGSTRVSIRLGCLPDAPPVISVPGAQTIAEDGSLTFSTGNGNAIGVADSDIGSSPARVTLAVAHGSLSLAPGSLSGVSFSGGDGTADPAMTFTGTLANVNAALVGLRYAPAQNFNGADQLSVTVSDQGAGGQDGPRVAGGTVAITVTAANDAPVAAADSYTVVAGQTLTVNAPGVLANDTDVDSGALKATLDTGVTAQQGTLTFNPDQQGGFSFTPAATFAGIAIFTYTVSDGSATSAPATVSLTVTNAAPTAGNDSYSVTNGTTLTVSAPGVLANDVDPDSSSLSTVTPVASGPSHGNLTFNADGSFVYTPSSGYTGPDSFTYQASDGISQSSPATVSITVGNMAPTAGNDSFSVTAATTLTIPKPGLLANDVDPDSPSLTATKASDPAHGSLTVNADGSFTYTPNAGYSGPDSFTYTASDSIVQSSPATVSISVGNIPPTAGNDSYTAGAGTTLSVDAPGLLANDVDPDSPTITAVKASDPAHGSLTLSAHGSFTYTPAPGYTGSDSFTYQASDGIAQSNAATVSLTVGNAPPTAGNDSYLVMAGTALTIAAPGVLANDQDADSTTLMAAKASDPAHGSVTLQPNGGFTYTPAAGYAGSDSFTYRASDGISPSQSATVNLIVLAANTPPTGANIGPVAGDDSYVVGIGAPLMVNASGVLANDVDPDSPALTASKVTDPAHGTVTLQPNGGFTYTPAPGYTGVDSFTYKASDGAAQSGPATVRIVVTAGGAPPALGQSSVASPPTAGNDSYTTIAQIWLTVPAPGLLANDTDPDSPSLTIFKLTNPAHGTVDLNADGSFTYKPNPEFVGTDSFTYRASDGSQLSNVATVTITITPTACVPTPRVQTNPAPGGGKLQVHVGSTPLNSGQANPLKELRFGTLQNARVSLNGQTVSSGQTVTVPAGATGVDFTVERIKPGEATTVPFTVVDNCGEWQTFVGGGTSAGF